MINNKKCILLVIFSYNLFIKISDVSQFYYFPFHMSYFSEFFNHHQGFISNKKLKYRGTKTLNLN